MPYAVPAVSLSVAANAVSAHVFSGNVYEVLTRPSQVNFGIVASAAGILTTVMVGTRIIAQDQEVSGANRFPIVPDDFLINGPGVPGEKLYVTFRNRTAGALTVTCAVNIQPVA